MPIKGRIDMLTTGIRTPIGIKIMGGDIKEIEKIGMHIEGLIMDLNGTRSVYAERVGGGYYINIIPDRYALAQYGLTVEDLQSIIATAIGGQTIITTIQNSRERYSINVRYQRDFRSNIDELERVLIATKNKFHVPLKEGSCINISGMQKNAINFLRH
jgi:Cu(I)/Ag(I) efflux system membrane protein CusA/SilA